MGIISLCFFLSGMAGLIYQMVWMRYLSTAFGTSEMAIIAVLVAYMGGLAAGSALASKFLHRLKRPVLAYAILEIIIALSAIAVPLLLKLADSLRTAALGGLDHLPADGGTIEALSHLGLGCLVLFIPTACMGATLPILAKGLVQKTQEIGSRIGWLYALNTFGAVAGTLTAAFLLIPALGLWNSSFIGVALNLTVAVLGWSAARNSERTNLPSAGLDPPEEESPAVSPRLVLTVMLLSGAIAFVYEILWSRLLAHVLGGSFYSFATMLASFLLGIAVGGLIGSRLARNNLGSCYWLAAFQIATGLLTALILALVSSDRIGDSSATIFAQATICILVLTPATICLGATFPLGVRCLSTSPRSAGPASGRLYAWNTVGAIVGAVAAGLLIIPMLGFSGTFKWAVATNLLLATVLIGALRQKSRTPLIASAILTLATVLFYHPAPPLSLLVRSPLDQNKESMDDLKLIHYATGKSATVSILERQGNLVIRSNGLQEAEIFPKGAEALSYTHIRWLPALPKVLKPDAESMLVVGFGGGALLESVPPGFSEIDVVEIEEEIIKANELVADQRAIDPFKDDRINVIINDARGALKLSTKKYDTIVSQPSHPWTAGASHLYTREFLAIASNHLNPGGVLVQWLGSTFVDQFLLASFMASAVDVFPHVQLYLVSDNFVIVASDESLDGRMWAKESLFDLSHYPKLSYLEDLLAVLQLDESGCREFAKGFSPITDDRNFMATHHLPGKQFNGALNQPENLTRVIGPHHFLNRDPEAVRKKLKDAKVDLRYLTRLLKSGSPALDREQFFTQVLDQNDRNLIKLSALVDSRPDLVLQELENSPADGISRSETLPLIALAQFTDITKRWNREKTILPPTEYSDFLKEVPEFRDLVQELDEQGQFLLEARYWALTNQLARVRKEEARLAEFDDHRSLWFEPAYQCRIASWGRYRGKSDPEIVADAAKAVDLINHLLSLPLEKNLPLVSQRIVLAQAFRDEPFLRSIAWIIVAKMKTAPESSRRAFGSLLGSIFTPYLSHSEGDTPSFTNTSMKKLYQDVSEVVGPKTIPLTRPKKPATTQQPGSR